MRWKRWDGCVRRIPAPSATKTTHIQNPDERDVDARCGGNAAAISKTFRRTDEKRRVLQRLTEVETFERFLHQTFVGAKRFSIEGSDSPGSDAGSNHSRRLALGNP